MAVYLDNAATTRVCTEAADAAYKIMTEDFGNPSSTHKMGRDAKAILEASRAAVAKALGAKPEEVFFTSGGSESDNWAVLSSAELMKHRGRHIISSEVEHAAVLRSLDLLEKRGFEVTRLKPEKDGSISVEKVTGALREDTVLVSLMLVNNETGGITDISEISRHLKNKGSAALLHTDAVQGFLKVPFFARDLGADLISVSGHKIHAPKGVGAVYVRGGVKALNLAPLIVGGGHESGRRSGTEGLPQIAAFAKAAELGSVHFEESVRSFTRLKELAIRRLTEENEGLQVLSGKAPHILSISLPGYKSQVVMNYLDGMGIYISNSSACKKGGRSYVLEALGLPDRVVDGALRISFSRFSTEDEVNALCDGIKSARDRLFTTLR
ncbi:MAG: cysteine desulfurase family protein [Oscillospiraceae bacterium]|nr:cysteine desulfurase family protein [Oscillospiraceae bacterium]